MAQSWVMLRGSNRKIWIMAIITLLVIIMAVYELLYPGTIISFFLKIFTTIVQIGGYFRDVANSLGELIRGISDWLR